MEAITDVDPNIAPQIRKEQCWRAIYMCCILLIGSGIIWLVDRGTPALLHFHWNGLDGAIYHWVTQQQQPQRQHHSKDSESIPRFVVYLLLSLFATVFLAGLAQLWFMCMEYCRDPYHAHPPHRQLWCCNCNCGPMEMELCACEGESGLVLLGVFFVIICLIGIYVLFMTVVGGVTNVVDRQRQTRIHLLETQLHRVKNLRPLVTSTASVCVPPS
jgi:hypothetical protein